jgi:MFS family permease
MALNEGMIEMTGTVNLMYPQYQAAPSLDLPLPQSENQVRVHAVLVPAFTVVAEDLRCTSTQVSLLNGALILALGVSSCICTCLAPLYGDRIIFIVTTIMLVLSSIWGATSKSYGSLVASRVGQGSQYSFIISETITYLQCRARHGRIPCCAPTSSINDIFFIHQCGFWVGLWNMASIASINIAPVISAYVIIDISWP